MAQMGLIWPTLGILPQFGQSPFSGYLDIVVFMVCAIFSYSRWQPACSAKLQKTK